MGTDAAYDDLQAVLDDAVELGYEDAQSGLKVLVEIYAGMSRLSHRELVANDGRLRKLRENTSRHIVTLYSILGDYENALAQLDAAEWMVDGEPSQFENTLRAYLLYNLGQPRAAATLIYDVIREETEPSFLVLPTRFCEVLRYRQYDLAHTWLEEKRNPQSATAEWLAPDGRSLLYRLEAQLLVEEGQGERAIVAYDKAVRAGERDMVFPNGISEDLIMAGRPNLGLRLLHAKNEDSAERVWRGIGLRMLGKNEEADPVFLSMIETEMPKDEFLIQKRALAACYLGERVAEMAAELDTYMEEGAEFEAVLQYAIGVVNGVLGNSERANSAFAEAVLDTRRHFNGHLLNREHWFHVKELFTPALLEEVRGNFDPTLMPDRYL